MQPSTLALLLLLVLARISVAQAPQTQPEHAPPAPAQTDTPTLAQALEAAGRDLPPPQALGARAALLRASQRVVPVVVIVGSADEYIDAVSVWRTHLRFPILIDDGSARAGQDIARFVRAFKPDDVVRWTGKAAETGPGDRADRIMAAWSRAIGFAEPPADTRGQALAFQKAGVSPIGLVVTDPQNQAWPGALALAAGRFQLLGLVQDPGGRRSGAWTPDQADALGSQIESIATRSGLLWDEIGDDLDALTIALDGPIKLEAQPGEFLSITDRLSRRGNGGAGPVWCWTGQVVGDHAQSAYAAMCALFLETDSAWVFNGHATGPQWDAYAPDGARGYLENRGISAVFSLPPRNSLEDWRTLASRPVDAGLLIVNTSGRPFEFELRPGGRNERGAPGDAPELSRPALLHLIHSFSLAASGNRDTVGPRWLERGVYAMRGSVQEPFLQSFVPPELVAARLTNGFPWGAAVHAEGRQLWKLTTLGDPLITLSSAGTRLAETPPMVGVEDIADAMRAALKNEEFAAGIRALELLGRDEDASRLVSGLLRDRSEALTPEVASAAMGPMARAGDADEALRVAARLGPDPDPIAVDHAWMAGRRAMRTGDRHGLAAGTLRSLVRRRQIVSDAAELGDHVRRRDGGAAAGSLVQGLVPMAGNPRHRSSLEKLAREYISGRR